MLPLQVVSTSDAYGWTSTFCHGMVRDQNVLIKFHNPLYNNTVRMYECKWVVVGVAIWFDVCHHQSGVHMLWLSFVSHNICTSQWTCGVAYKHLKWWKYILHEHRLVRSGIKSNGSACLWGHRTLFVIHVKSMYVHGHVHVWGCIDNYCNTVIEINALLSKANSP